MFKLKLFLQWKTCSNYFKVKKIKKTWFPNTPIAQAVETSFSPNQVAASLEGTPRINTLKFFLNNFCIKRKFLLKYITFIKYTFDKA